MRVLSDVPVSRNLNLLKNVEENFVFLTLKLFRYSNLMAYNDLAKKEPSL